MRGVLHFCAGGSEVSAPRPHPTRCPLKTRDSGGQHQAARPRPLTCDEGGSHRVLVAWRSDTAPVREATAGFDLRYVHLETDPLVEGFEIAGIAARIGSLQEGLEECAAAALALRSGSTPMTHRSPCRPSVTSSLRSRPDAAISASVVGHRPGAIQHATASSRGLHHTSPVASPSAGTRSKCPCRWRARLVGSGSMYTVKGSSAKACAKVAAQAGRNQLAQCRAACAERRPLTAAVRLTRADLRGRGIAERDAPSPLSGVQLVKEPGRCLQYSCHRSGLGWVAGNRCERVIREPHFATAIVIDDNARQVIAVGVRPRYRGPRSECRWRCRRPAAVAGQRMRKS